ALSRQIGGDGFPSTTTTTTVTDAEAVSVPSRRGSGRTPLAKTGGCGSKGSSPALGSWADEEQSDDEEEGGLSQQGGSDGELRQRVAGGEAHTVTTRTCTDVPATTEGVTAANNDDGSEYSEKKTCGEEGVAGEEGAGQGLVSEPRPVKAGALHEEPGRLDGLVSTKSGGGEAREDVDVRVGPGVDEQGAASATPVAAATLEIEHAQQSVVPEMSPTPHTRTGFHEAEVPRAEGTGTDAEEAEGGVFE
ncbi:unnamed protein product, partial [Laminaria digitata]